MATTTNFGWETPDDTDLVKDGAAAIRTVANSIDTSFVDLKGGTTGQILSKASNTDLDYAWITNDVGDITAVTAGTGISGGGTSGAVTITNSMATAIDAKGDLIAGTGADTFDRLAIGANGTVLTADSAETTGLKWATPASGGMTLISTTTLSTASTSISVTSTGYTQLLLYIVGAHASSNSEITFTLNNNTTANYIMSWYGRTGGGAFASNTSGGVAYFRISGTETNGVSGAVSEFNHNEYIIQIFDPANTATFPRAIQAYGSGYNQSGQQFIYNTTGGKLGLNAAISSIQIKTTAGTWSGGTVYLYGVK